MKITINITPDGTAITIKGIEPGTLTVEPRGLLAISETQSVAEVASFTGDNQNNFDWVEDES